MSTDMQPHLASESFDAEPSESEPLRGRAARKAAKAQRSAEATDAKAAQMMAATFGAPTTARAPEVGNPYTGYVEGTKLKKFRLSHKVKVVWLTTLAQQVRVGLTPQESLATLGNDANVKKRHGMYEASAFADEMMSRGYSFADAIEKTGVLDDAVITSMKAGHHAGHLADTLTQSAQRLERSYKLKSKIRGAMMMPIITTLVAAAIGTYVLMKVVPVLGSVFTSLGHDLPTITKMLVGLSHQMPKILLAVFLLAALSTFTYKAARRSPANRLKIDRFKLRIPIVGVMLADSALASVFQTLGLLLSSGIANRDALASAAGSAKNAALVDIFIRAAESAEATGTRLSEFLAAEKLIPAVDKALIRAGEKSGSPFEGVAKAAEFHFIEADRRAAQISDTIAPLMTVVIGGAVGFIVMGIYLPMFQMYGLLGQQV